MPIKLIPPRKGFSPYYYGRGTYLGVFVNRSTQAVRAPLAKRVIRGWEEQIERGRFDAKVGPTFTQGAIAYKVAGGDERFVPRLIAYFKDTPLADIGQEQVDTAAAELYPTQSNATRNREVYTPISAILKQAGFDHRLRRPKGSRGKVLTGWLWPEEAERLFNAAHDKDREFAALLVYLCYTGCRLNEALKLRCEDVRLAESEALVRMTKNGDPRRVFLPAVVVAELANHPRGLERQGERVFRWVKSGRLYNLLNEVAKNAGVELPERSAFHVFRHTYATWMRRFAGADAKTLVATGAWKSEQSASRYAHAVVTEEAKLASMLPVAKLRNR
jgi:integrase